ncbi:hypothetical protein RN001_008180 [Aquatica leii]|uniref:CRAL-TRIO domain-containing protein n=1 Tax=Aquatica leii TaxID=1421715 RepID=A0AAN7SH61_9COLE|nr:hypothetical protein RN001_008180 [Aquatica leii]
MYKREWTKELELKALDEVYEVTNKKEQDINHIRKWLLLEPNIRARSDREWILNFLRGCKFNIPKTQEKLKYLHMVKTTLPEFYSNRDPLLPEMQELLNRCILLPHSTKNEELMIVRWCNVDTKRVSLINIFKVAFMFLDVAMIESSSLLVLGYHIMVDLKYFPLSLIKQMSPSVLKKIFCTFLKAYPIRIKGIYIFNVFPFFSTIYNIVAPLFGEKMVGRMKVYDHFDIEELCKYISISSVPKEYQGTSDSIDEIGERWKLHLKSYREWFLEDEQYRSDGSFSEIQNT